MINFDEEIRKFKPILEIEQAETIIRNQDLQDMADVALGIIAEARDEAASSAARAMQTGNSGYETAYSSQQMYGETQNFGGGDALL